MSHELQFPELIIEPDYNWDDTISINGNSSYFYVPSVPEWAYVEFDGLFYEGIQYNWKEVDYRLSVDYTGASVPEPASAGGIIGIAVLIFVLYKIFMKKGTTQMKCVLCKTKDRIISFIKKLYNKITTK
jgi:hypothetical protein